MEEEPNEHELEERLYAMLHHVDETQANVNTDTQNDPARLVENAPRSTVRRYWRTNSENARNTNPYSKVNTPKDSVSAPMSKNPTTTNTNNTKPKEEKNGKPEPAVDLSLFQTPPQIVKRTIEILEHENQSFVLESSDEDEVIEVELPPKPTITIESSDEDDLSVVSKPETPSIDQLTTNSAAGNATPTTAEREISASPVPSVVSSVSDDFIRGDCIALNISSRHSDNHSFDFSLHGSDLLGQVTPSKKKKKKKSKEAITSTPIRPTAEKPSNVSVDTCFATPKSKVKNKKQKAKSYSVSEKSLPSADVYDSDSNQSVIEPVKDQAANNVSEKIIPISDIYELDASLPENKTDKSKSLQNNHGNKSSDVSTSLDQSNKDNRTKNCKKNDTTAESYKTANSIVDLTDSDNYITLDTSDILCENIVMANVTGFKESEDYGDKTSDNDAPKFGSTKVPQILFENLDFDNLKGKDKVCKRRKYSLTTLRAEMEKFYNESWGGEDFNHREIQKYMSRDKNLWVIDPKDRMPSLSKRKVTCNYCNRPGHRDDACRQKPPVCHMCGSTGHYEPRCPSKICVNCGSPNFMYSTMCRNCATWDRVRCAECGQGGHPSSHCPDVWRRYHNTISMNMPLAENRQIKRNSQLYCSGCTRRGHLVHACRSALPFSGLPLNSPYVAFYRPVFVPTEEEPDQPRRQLLNKTFPQDSATAITQRNKRQSKSPMHEAHVNKKKNMTITEIVETPEKQKTNEGRQRKYSQGKNQPEENKAKELGKSAEAPKTQPATVEPAPDFIPISANTDKQGQMIQDNEVSDTSDVVTSARIYVTSEIIHKLKTPEDQYWLNEHMLKHDVTVQSSDVNSFLSIKGKFADQEAFQSELREWLKPTTDKENPKSDNEGDITLLTEHDQQHSSNIPKQRNTVLRKISKALESLKNDLGDPKDIYKELNFLQNKHDHLLQQKVISPKQLNNNRDHINIMLKKLNMVLLGQAGLADGSEHLNELHSLREKLTHFRQKSISLNMRREIGKHYHSIFTPIPRHDYADLLNLYYGARKDKILKRTNHKLQMVTKKRKRQRRNINPVAAAQNQTFPSIDKQDGNKNVVHRENTHSKKNAEHKLKKLTYFHRRVMNTRPADSVHKKTRMELARKLHTHIASLNRNEKMSSKTMKKVKRIQEQAALFLNNV